MRVQVAEVAELARMWLELAPSRSLWHESRMLQQVPCLGAEDQLARTVPAGAGKMIGWPYATAYASTRKKQSAME